MIRTIVNRAADLAANPALTALLLILLVAPWPLGSNRDWLWPLITMPVCVLTVIMLWLKPGTTLPRGVVIAFSGLLLWLGLQTYGIPFVLPPLSVDPALTSIDLMLSLTYACVFYLTLALVDRRIDLGLLLLALFIFGIIQMIAGLWQVFLLSYPSASGSFASPNHFAAYLYLCLCPFAGWLAAQVTSQFWSASTLLLLTVALTLLLIISESRMGLAAFVFGVTAACFYRQTLRHWVNANLATLATLAGIAIVLLIIVWAVNVGYGASTETRIPINQANLAIIIDHGWFGTGAGTFPLVFTEYRTDLIFDRVTYAENDYFEFLIELGLPGATALLILLATCLKQQYVLIVSKRDSEDNDARNIATGCLAATLALLAHSFTDFNLQIPANAMLAVIVMALPFTQALNTAPKQD